MNTKELYYIKIKKIKNYISPQELISTTTIIMKDIFNFSTNDIIINKKINLNNTYIEKTIENITKRLKKMNQYNTLLVNVIFLIVKYY